MRRYNKGGSYNDAIATYGQRVENKDIGNGLYEITAKDVSLCENNNFIFTFDGLDSVLSFTVFRWMPITGCKNKCRYCFQAHNLTVETPVMKTFMPNGMSPTYYNYKLFAPENTLRGRSDIAMSMKGYGYRNVLVGRSGDMFGSWIPDDWLRPIVNKANEYDMWNYFWLTKNPKRYLDFKFGFNSYLGIYASFYNEIDKDLKTIFKKIKENNICKNTFLMVDPILDDFYDIGDAMKYIDWVIIGGDVPVYGEKKTKADILADAIGYKLSDLDESWYNVERLMILARQYNTRIYVKNSVKVKPFEFPDGVDIVFDNYSDWESKLRLIYSKKKKVDL